MQRTGKRYLLDKTVMYMGCCRTWVYAYKRRSNHTCLIQDPENERGMGGSSWSCSVDTGPRIHALPQLATDFVGLHFNCFLFLRHTCTNGQPKPIGVYADLMHVCDLQICPDAITSTLLELTEPTPHASRDSKLAELLRQYQAWCSESGCWACHGG